MSIHIYTISVNDKGIKYLNYLNSTPNCFYSWDKAEAYTAEQVKLGADPTKIEAIEFINRGLRTDSTNYTWDGTGFRRVRHDTNWTGD